MAVVPFDAFGPGKVFVASTTAVDTTPVNIGYSQELTINFSASNKELTGQNQFPLDVARGVSKIDIKAKAAVLSAKAWNAIFFGQQFTSGSLVLADNEAVSVPASMPYTVQVSNHTNYEAASSISPYGGDLGVVYAAGANAGLSLQKVTGAPAAAGQYSVDPSTGTYTFYSGDAGASVLVTYRYTATTGQTLTVTNDLLGKTPIFQLDYYTIRNNKPFLVRFPQCAASKLTLGAKLEDFIQPEFDISAFANAAGKVVQFSYPEVS